MIRSRLRRAVRSAALITGLLASVMFASEAAASSDTTDSQTYTNHLMGFSITAPADWRISETGRRLPVVQLDPPGYTNFVSVQVSVHRHVGPDTTREWTDWQVSNYGKRFVTIHEESHVSLGPDTSGFRAVFEWHGELGIKEGWTGVLRGRQDFIIRAFGTATDFDRLRDTVDEIIRTFTLLTPDPTQASVRRHICPPERRAGHSRSRSAHRPGHRPDQLAVRRPREARRQYERGPRHRP